MRRKTWSIAKTLGRTAAKAKTSNCTLKLKVKNYPYVSNAGTK